MTFELFRELNTVIPLIAFGWLMARVRVAWPAEWAKPHHVYHYRAALLIIAAYVFLSGIGAIVHESLHTQATWVSPAYTFQALVVLAFCAQWPKPRSLRR